MASKVGKLAIMLGQCVPSVKHNASKIRIRKMELDTNLNMVRDKDPARIFHPHLTATTNNNITISHNRHAVFQKGLVRVRARPGESVQSGRHRARA